MYLGDITPGKTIDFTFNTRDASGAPITLAGTPAVKAYNGSSTTEDADGITLTVDFDGVTGLHRVAVDTSADGTFYAAGSNIRLVVTAGTVDGVSVVGTTLAEFSIANRSALRPATADRTLDVTAGGKAPSTVAVGDIASDAVSADAISAAAITKIQAGLATPTNITAGTITTVGTTTTVTNGVTVSDKTGFKLASDGLDLISTTAPVGVATNFREMVVQTWRRWFKKAVHDQTAETLKTYGDNETTVITTQELSEDDAGVETQGAAS